MSNLYIDIETIPTQNLSVIQSIKESIKHPGNISKPETIEKWYAENLDAEFDKKYRMTALDGLYGEIISIAWAIDDDFPNAVFRSKGLTTETELLNGFFNELLSDLKDKYGNRQAISRWVGHYITGFDLRFIWQRCVINQVQPSIHIPYDAKPWDNKVFDTKVAWSGVSQYSGASSLGKLCEGMGYAGKGDIDGSKVYDYWLAGKIEEIAEYNKDDVIKTRQLYKRMNFIQDDYYDLV